MHTLGVDLASQPPGTAACVIEWRTRRARIAVLESGVTDDRIVELASGCESFGIDAPFGWPDRFVEFMTALRTGDDVAQPWSNSWRDQLRFRLTDEIVGETLGLNPLSVSTALIALPALRCAGLLRRLGVRDRATDPRGHEVYPAAALAAWGLASRGYRGPARATVREASVDCLLKLAPGLELSEPHRIALAGSADALDALVCALVARAAALDLTTLPSPDGRERATREGWIHVPVGALVDLLSPSGDSVGRPS